MKSKLILVEGIPGSGKSALAQATARRLREAGVPVRWWYEEEVDHPVYVFRDAASLQEVTRDLFSGGHQRVIAAAVERWRHFAQETQRSPMPIVVDGTFLGYLTWTLHYLDRLPAETRAYVGHVEDAIASLAPRLLYLRHRDVAATMRHVLAVRGDGWAKRMIRRALDSPYGKAHDLAALGDFDGLVRYWSDYQVLADQVFAKTPLKKLAVDVKVGGWATIDAAIAAFLDLPARPGATSGDLSSPPAADLRCFTGAYQAPDGATAQVELAGGALIVRRLNQVWPGQRLVPIGTNTFEILSLPFTIHFEDNAMRVDGPDLFGGRPPRFLVRLTS